jgi:hypothetical protein
MKIKIKSPKDFWAGLLFIALGLFFLVGGRNYEMGSATRMGPAYFPSVLGGLMALIGGIIFFQSLVVKGENVPAMSFRPLFFITLALLLFGYLLRPIGLVLTVALMVFLSAFAGHEFKVKEVLLLSIGLIVIGVLVFVKSLSLPFPLWPGFLY